MHRSTAPRLAVAATMLLTFVLGACAPGSPPALPTPSPRTSPPEATRLAGPAATPRPAPAATPASPRQAPPAGQQVIRLSTAEPPTIDPGLATDTVSLDVVTQIFEGLVGFDDQGNVFGVEAERWDVSPDGLTYTFHLRDGPTWSDGKPVTARDYEYAWKRVVDPRTASDYASALYPIKNATKIHRENLDPEQLGVRAQDDRTLVVTLEAPAAYFLRLAATWTTMPVRRDVIERHGERWTEATNIVTNGPFLLKEWTHGQQIVLERNPGYWGAKPVLERAIFRIFPEGAEEQVLAAYENDELDVAVVPLAQIDRVMADPSLREQVRTFPQSGTFFLVVNTTRPHLADPRVRQALGQVIERQKLIDDVLKIAGQPAYTLQPEGIAGRNPDLWPKENVEEARSKLADAGFPDGRGFPEITYTTSGGARSLLLARYLQQRWKETLNVDVRIDALEWSVFLDWRAGDQWKNGGDLYRGGWLSDYEDPNNWFNVLWDSQQDYFHTFWKDDQYDRLVREARQELDRSRREQLYAQAEQVLARNYPAIPLWHYAEQRLVKPRVQGFQLARVLGFTPLTTISIAAR